MSRKAGCGDQVVREGRAGERIYDTDRPVARQQFAEIAGSHGQARNHVIEIETLAQAGPLHIGEEESAVPPDRPAQREAVLIAPQRLVGQLRARGRNVEEVAGIEDVIAQELEEAPVQGIRSTFERGVDQRRRMPVLGRHVRAFDLELLDRIHVWLHQCATQLRFGDGCAIERPAGVDLAHAINGDVHGSSANRVAVGWRILGDRGRYGPWC